MAQKIFSNPDIYRIEVILPNNPLGWLNCYVLPNSERPLIIDTGFNRPECYDAFMQGVQELGIDLAKADLFITHVHGDHSGLAYKLSQLGTTIYMNPIDYAHFTNMIAGEGWNYLEELFAREGFPPEEIEAQKGVNHARLYGPEKLYPVIPVNDGDRLHLAGQEFLAIWTPGHTKGHICLYLEEKKAMFLGDHVLFDITPNITCWQGAADSLGDYLKSLDKIDRYPVEVPLPGHRKNEMEMSARIAQIKAHHDNRLDSTRAIIAGEPGLGAYEIAARLSWSMRGKSWTEAAVGQKWFAVGETISHLDYLLLRNEIRREEKNGKRAYFSA